MALKPWEDMLPTVPLAERDGSIRLLAGRCESCGALDFPAVPFCRRCLRDDVRVEEIPSEGILYSFTTIHSAAETYTVGYVDLPEGIRAFGHIVGDVSIGDEVAVVNTDLPVTYAAVTAR